MKPGLTTFSLQHKKQMNFLLKKFYLTQKTIEMKKHIIYIVSGVMLMITGCRKLDVPVKSQYTDENFPTTPAAYAAAIGPLYTQLANNGNVSYAVDYWRIQELSTDEAIIPARDGNYDDGGQYRFMHLHTWTKDHPYASSSWEWGFGGINTANRLLALFGTAPDNESKPKAIAEVKAMRSLFYFIMMDLYGNIPIIDSFPVKDLPATVERKKVFEFIENDIKSALPNLSAINNASTYGHANKWMAFALLTKMYLNAEYYTGTPRYADAVAMADSLIASNTFALDADYTSIFKASNGPGTKEFIFAVPYDANLIPGNHFTRFSLHPYLQAKYSIPFRPSVALSTIPDFYAHFNLPGDVRNSTWLSGKQYNWDGSPIMVKTTMKTLDQTFSGADYPIEWQVEISPELKLVKPETMDVGNDILGQLKGVRSIKFYPDANSNPSTRYQSNDVPVFRFADILLMKAEAILRGAAATTVNGELQTADVLVNKIRKRAGTTEVASISLDELLNERARELYWEGWRRNDLIRFGKFENAWGFKTNAEKFRRIFPVPTKEIALNPNLKQNDGY